VPCLVVTWEAGRFLLGPLRVPGRDGGFCAARASMLAALPGVEAPYLGHFTAGVLAADDAGLAGETAALLDAAVSAVVAEIECLPARDRVPALSASCQVIGPEGAARYPLPAPATGSAAASDLALAADIAVSRRAVLAERPREPMPSRLGSVGIIGGGTAGYLTALALRKKLPHLRVYLLESSRIPVIGVGEATTALLTHFLHDYLELDVVDFHAAVAPTFKLGIRFEWGQPGDHHFNSPFQFGRLLESLIHGGDLDRNCLASQLMSADRGPVARSPDGSLRSLLSEVPYAYHIDNQRFLRYLADQARRAGVVHLDSTVTEVALGSDGHTIERIFSDDGRAFRFDLYVDCTGFRSLLLGKTLGTPFITYDSSLPVDRAIVANVPHGGRVRPYTVAETMDSGWCWTIPMMDEDHRGYVHASAFCSEAQAIDEMRRKNPGMSEPWVVRFRSGRHRDFWRGNVVAIGNSYAFVEPLQSTAIHMIIVQIQKLVESFPQDAGQYAFQPVINREVAALWDHLRYFLALHYRYNQRCASEFWRSCRAGIDISGLEEYVALYQEKAPIAGRGPRFAELDASTFGVFRHDLLFMGLGLPTSYVEPVESCDSWRRITAAVERVVAHCLPHVEALQALRAEPGMLRRHIAELRGS
jgi:tryptophan halogenase